MGYYSYGLRGDYYRGDPGFLSTIGGFVGKLLGVNKGENGGGGGGGSPLQSIISTVSKLGGGRAATTAVVPKGFYSGASAKVGSLATKAIGTVKAHPVLTAAGAAGIAGVAAGVGGSALAAHMRGGGRKHRRMRVTNPKALRRAIRRTQGFAKLAMRTIHLVHPKKHARFGGFKRRKKSR